MTELVRVRFQANLEDYRPVVWPVKHPYWCSGYNDAFSIVITYADKSNYQEYINTLWPETVGEDLDVMEEYDEYQFSDRFPCPEWFDPDNVNQDWEIPKP